MTNIEKRGSGFGNEVNEGREDSAGYVKASPNCLEQTVSRNLEAGSLSYSGRKLNNTLTFSRRK